MRKGLVKRYWETERTVADAGEPWEQVVRIRLAEWAFFMLLLIFSTAIVYSTRGQNLYQLSNALENALTERKFMAKEQFIKFANIRTAAEVIAYFSWLPDAIQSDSDGSDTTENRIIDENIWIGVPLLRQHRVRNDSCEVHSYFVRYFFNCYGYYDANYEDRGDEPILDDEFELPLEEPDDGPKLKYMSAAETNYLGYFGEVSHYDGGGLVLEWPSNSSGNLDFIDLVRNDLVKRSTRVLFFDLTVYNVNLNTFCVIKLVLEMPPAGGVLVAKHFKSFHFLRYLTWSDYFIFAVEFVFIELIFYYFIQELYELFFYGRRYFVLSKNYLDLCILIGAFGMAIFTVQRNLLIYNIYKQSLMNNTRHISFDRIAYAEEIFNICSALTIVSVYIKFYEYLSFNRVLKHLHDTVTTILMDFVLYIIFFSIIMFSYAMLACVMFGESLKDFSGPFESFLSLFRLLFGDLDIFEIQEIFPIRGPLFLIFFIVVIFFVLMRIFLAIMNYGYYEVTNRTKEYREVTESEYLLRAYANLCTCSGRRPGFCQINDHKKKFKEIKRALKKNNFTNLEVDLFLSQYDLDEIRVMTKEDINQIIRDLKRKGHHPTILRPAIYLYKGHIYTPEDLVQLTVESVGQINPKQELPGISTNDYKLLIAQMAQTRVMLDVVSERFCDILDYVEDLERDLAMDPSLIKPE